MSETVSPVLPLGLVAAPLSTLRTCSVTNFLDPNKNTEEKRYFFFDAEPFSLRQLCLRDPHTAGLAGGALHPSASAGTCGGMELLVVDSMELFV